MHENPRRWLILVVLCLSTLVLVIDNMALTVALPPLAADLGATAQDVQWVMESYMLVFAGLLLSAGSLADRFGRRKIMIFGLVLFGAASLLATLASSPGELIAARVVMGVGGALVMPSTLSILIVVFTDEAQRRKAMAVWGAVSMIGLIGGPVVGGALIASYGWESVFLINVPIAALAVLAALTLMPESKGPWAKADPIGALLSVVGMTSLVWAINEWPAHGITPAAGIAVVALGAFVAWEVRTPYPMVPLRLFRDRNFAGGSLSLTLVQVGNGGMMLVFTQYLQLVLGYTPTEAGLAFIPMAVAALLFNGVGAGLGGKLGNRVTVAIGLVVMAGAFVLLAFADGTWMLMAGQFVLGAGGGLAMPSAVAALMGAVPPEQAGVGSALNDTIQQAGAALGVALLGSVATAVFTAGMPAGSPGSLAEAVTDPALAAAARTAYDSALTGTFLAAAAGVVAAAVVALALMRDRKPAPVEPVAAAA
ncbi:MAG: MFS transporter [Nonomuraea sp.]|nr:MFS transporter [Nonomuraea sp.]